MSARSRGRDSRRGRQGAGRWQEAQDPPTDYYPATTYPRGEAHPYKAAEGWDDDEYDEPRPRGRVRLISGGRVLLLLLVLATGAVAGYGMFLDKSASQLPISVAGLATLGLSSLALALSLARAAAQLGRRGQGGRALWAALLGGLFILGAAGALSGAIVLGIVLLG